MISEDSSLEDEAHWHHQSKIKLQQNREDAMRDTHDIALYQQMLISPTSRASHVLQHLQNGDSSKKQLEHR